MNKTTITKRYNIYCMRHCSDRVISYRRYKHFVIKIWYSYRCQGNHKKFKRGDLINSINYI